MAHRLHVSVRVVAARRRRLRAQHARLCHSQSHMRAYEQANLSVPAHSFAQQRSRTRRADVLVLGLRAALLLVCARLAGTRLPLCDHERGEHSLLVQERARCGHRSRASLASGRLAASLHDQVAISRLACIILGLLAPQLAHLLHRSGEKRRRLLQHCQVSCHKQLLQQAAIFPHPDRRIDHVRGLHCARFAHHYSRDRL